VSAAAVVDVKDVSRLRGLARRQDRIVIESRPSRYIGQYCAPTLLQFWQCAPVVNASQ